MDGDLVYKSGGTALCYKRGGAPLVYKATPGGETEVSFAWGSDGRDLDICAYWLGDASYKIGYGYSTETAEHVSADGVYHSRYSGDIRGTDDSEWVKLRMTPWSGGARTFKVHLNYYGWDSSSSPADTCTVIASQAGGNTLVLRNVTCGTTAQSPATTGHHGVVVTFDADGKLSTLEAF